MKVETVIYKMLIEGTGSALCDSGGDNNRNWQQNQKRSLKDFQNDPDVSWDGDSYTISLFHYLKNALVIDGICNDFNNINIGSDWTSEDFYGVGAKAENFVKELNFEIGRTFNSYNGESALSQVIQGTWISLGDRQYLILQIHQGCDVRGGYTDARLFYVPEYENGAFLEDVYGTVTRKDGQVVQVDNMYNGYSLTDEDGVEIKITESDKVELELTEV